MAKNKNGDDSSEAIDAAARLVTSAEDQAKATKWFARALELGEKRQFDYAIEYYVNGLEFWPDAIEEGCKPLHGCAVARHQTGGKKPGFKDTMKRSLSDKDPKRAFVNALWLFGHDPENFSYIEGVARNASRLRAEDAAKWAGGVTLKALESNAKATAKQFQQVVNLFEELGDRAAEREESGFGVEVYQMGVDTLNLWRRRTPKDRLIENALRDMSTKLTILRGKYKDGESFRDSIADTDAQMELHDEQRSVQSDQRLDALISLADKEYQEDPDKAGVLTKLVDLLGRRERDDEEVRAIGLLVNHYKRTNDYRWKQTADNIRMKQLSRQGRRLEKAGDEEAAKEHQVNQLRFELRVFKERLERYPTDNRIRFEFGVRCFRAGRFDDAIPLFQTARTDPKNRSACALYLGRCFFRKGLHSQAVAALQEGLEEHQYKDDDLAKSMGYWLARSFEANGKIEEARKTYGKILQMDYNYRDVRARLSGLAADEGD
jgi:tetratricopeptide (TPR) repeat protein